MFDYVYSGIAIFLTVLILLFSFAVAHVLHQSCVFSTVLISSISCLVGIFNDAIYGEAFKPGELRAAVLTIRGAAIISVVAILPGLLIGEVFNYIHLSLVGQFGEGIFVSSLMMIFGPCVLLWLVKHSRSKEAEAPEGYT